MTTTSPSMPLEIETTTNGFLVETYTFRPPKKHSSQSQIRYKWGLYVGGKLQKAVTGFGFTEYDTAVRAATSAAMLFGQENGVRAMVHDIGRDLMFEGM